MPERTCQTLVFGLLVAFVSLCGCWALQFAESKGPEAGEEIELCWKAAKGEKLCYDYYEQIESGETFEKEITILWSDDKAAVTFDSEKIIMDRQGRFYNAENPSLPPDEQTRFILSTLFPLPERKIERGESWTIEVGGKEGKQEKRFSGSVTAVFSGFEELEGKKCAVITVNTKSEDSVDLPQFTFTAVEVSSGTILFEVASNRFVKGELSGELTSTSRLKPEKAEDLAPPERKITEKFTTGYTLRKE
jgi:hypothetical protein